MLKDLVTQLEGKNVVVSSAPGNGASSFALYIANTILCTDKMVLYYNPTNDIDRNFVKKYYPRLFKHAVWLISPIASFLEYFQQASHDYDCIVIDPGDALMSNNKIIPQLGKLKKKGSSLVTTSQIRQDPKKGWATYSTIEKLNAFDYSVWLTNVTSVHPIFKQKYVDVFTEIRSGNNFKLREIAFFTREGNIIDYK